MLDDWQKIGVGLTGFGVFFYLPWNFNAF